MNFGNNVTIPVKPVGPWREGGTDRTNAMLGCHSRTQAVNVARHITRDIPGDIPGDVAGDIPDKTICNGQRTALCCCTHNNPLELFFFILLILKHF
jgi:hypothetical protein